MIEEQTPLHLFEGYGIELEYMIVNQSDLNIAPLTDQVIHHIAGEYLSEIEMNELCWSNELVLHVIEIKTNGPAKQLTSLSSVFQSHVSKINDILNPMKATLMPTAMHPWMNPLTETRLWPHENNPIYNAFNKIFGCQGHGWSNLQSMHINLPFYDDREFAQLHSAIRILLPILPALSASSPMVDYCFSGFLDKRLDVYRFNSSKIPSITGKIIPEAVFSQKDYEIQILNRIYQDIAPYDQDKILQYEWLNARGAIARFDRNTIEIRVLDVQECPKADLAIAILVSTVLKLIIEERWLGLKAQQDWNVDPLFDILLGTMTRAESFIIENTRYLALFGLNNLKKIKAGELWQHLIENVVLEKEQRDVLNIIIQKGSLARRILNVLGTDFTKNELHGVYQKLSDNLAQGELFIG